MTEARKNIIVGHGGKQGPSSATYLRGQKIDAETAKHVPASLKVESPGGDDAPTAAVPSPGRAPIPIQPSGPPVPAHPGDKAGPPPKEEGAPASGTPSGGAQTPAQPPTGSPPSRGNAGRRPASVPSTRKGVEKLDRAAAVAMARDTLGAEFSDETPLKEIHEKLVKGLSIE